MFFNATKRRMADGFTTTLSGGKGLPVWFFRVTRVLQHRARVVRARLRPRVYVQCEGNKFVLVATNDFILG